MKIQELARKTGLTTYTIRFYEKQGLLAERYITRGANNYREYNDEVIERLNMIKKFQSIDCSLAELRDILHDQDHHVRSNVEVIEWIRKKVRDVEAKKDEYEQMLQTLNKMLEYRASLNKKPLAK